MPAMVDELKIIWGKASRSKSNIENSLKTDKYMIIYNNKDIQKIY